MQVVKCEHGWLHAAPGTMRCLYCGLSRPATPEERALAGEIQKEVVKCPYCGWTWTPRRIKPVSCARCKRYLPWSKSDI